MKSFTQAAVIGMALLRCAVADESSRFVIETHPVSSAESQGELSVTLKLDTFTGDIWRYTGGDFLQIPVARTWSGGVDRNAKGNIDEQRGRAALLKRMDTIVIPEIDFRQTKVRDALIALQEASARCDPKGQGVNLILNLNLGAVPVQTGTTDPFASASAGTIDETKWVPPITFSAKQITLRAALNIVTEVAGLRYKVKDGAVMVLPIGSDLSEIVYRLYDLLPSTLKRIQECQPALYETNQSPASAESRWKEFFSPLGGGVGWPSGSSIKPVPIMGKVFVANTPDGLAAFEGILQGINSYPPRAGRFRLQAVRKGAFPVLLLLDSDTGHTWQYDVTALDDAKREILSDTFLSVPEREKDPDPSAQ
jgi:hypothetical protein